MTKFEYKEPEFNVVQANTEDVLTLSSEQLDWDTANGKNGNNGAVGFGFTI